MTIIGVVQKVGSGFSYYLTEKPQWTFGLTQ